MTDDLSDLNIQDKKQLKSVSQKMGRPRKDDRDKLSKKVSINFTSDEYDNLLNCSGTIPLTSFIKMCLKDKGFI